MPSFLKLLLLPSVWKKLGSISSIDELLRGRKRRPRPQKPAETIDDAITDAAQQTFSKEAKLQAANDAVIVRQNKQIADDEINAVQQLRDKHLKLSTANKKQGQGDADFIVADDMQFHFEQPRSSPLGTILAAGAVAFGGWALWDRLHDEPNPEVIEKPAETIEKETVIDNTKNKTVKVRVIPPEDAE